ncbi:tubulin-folding cofactor E [Amborella trichopoda]|uniref:CAP-Gly domain-containing protein n=1 Tax=Amborella trichopoda TaxID=13333 RepID=W1NYD7_AMBTC|nr:tubulin-folding cofactor E [Amborella trichopoda]ERM99679.1 hypothetical protein AMTR_s00099p00048900 [Amborella trichopoda]|eukprot:XP_020519086.1 tubulin-folding cofactor E [Amborella trichopoda]
MSSDKQPDFKIDRRVHSVDDPHRTGTVKYVGPVHGYSGFWVGLDWDNGDGKHDGSVNGVRYFQARSEHSGSLVRPHALSKGISFVEALDRRYRADSTKEEEDEMYVLSTSKRRVNIELVGKNKVQEKLQKFEDMHCASLACLGVSSPGSPHAIGAIVPNLRELDLTGSLLGDWQDVCAICEQLPVLEVLNLSNNQMSHNALAMPLLKSIRILVLNNCGITWKQVEILKHSLPALEELHLLSNQLESIELSTGKKVQGFDSLRILNLEDNCINTWDAVLKLSQLRSLEQLHLNKNSLKDIYYPDFVSIDDSICACEPQDSSFKPFENLGCLLLGDNKINDFSSVDSLNKFPSLVDVRLSGNPIADPSSGGLPRFVLIGRLAKIAVLNGSEVSPRERKDSEIRYVRLVMSKMNIFGQEEIRWLHPRFFELKDRHGIEYMDRSTGNAGLQKMASSLLSITFKCIGASMGERPSITKKLPATTTVGKLKALCESFFKLKSMKLKLFLQEEVWI